MSYKNKYNNTGKYNSYKNNKFHQNKITHKKHYGDNNKKRILCYNIIGPDKKCNYSNQCKFAHSLSEQKIDPIRHKVYTILDNNTNLSDINLIDDKKLYNTLMILTKVCNGCIKNKCPGGKNCREGAWDIKYRICYDDIMTGTCRYNNCKNVHLTNRGLKPYKLQKSIYYKRDNIDDDIDNNYKKNKKKYNINMYNKCMGCYNKSLSSIDGVLLTDKFFLRYLSKKHNNNYNYSPDSDTSSEDMEKIIKWLNNNDDDTDYDDIKNR